MQHERKDRKYLMTDRKERTISINLYKCSKEILIYPIRGKLFSSSLKISEAHGIINATFSEKEIGKGARKLA